MTMREYVDLLTHDGDCDRCTFGCCGDCHLQCTHIDNPDEVIPEPSDPEEEVELTQCERCGYYWQEGNESHPCCHYDGPDEWCPCAQDDTYYDEED